MGLLRSVVEKKGYKPIGACEIIMPSNIFFIPDGRTCDDKVRTGLVKAEKYALSILDGSSRWGRVPVLSDAMHTISSGLLKLAEADLHQKYIKFRADKSKCSKCCICVDICPVGNIEMGEYPETGNNCQYCLRCVSFCPRSALPCMFNYKGKTYRAVDLEDFRE
ncbi:EFR1 family ferrodoxin [Methanobacterium paludis]|uniref:EFR1 family ferrodoxin n=1 Tax=Methanobacterium paludis (strain DSM 25820 / JCM 18151 / SWAN1) TaxID=868131 RepID=UPI000AF5EBA2|nr:EFR1 family ferrodoxin [Methanobacterium paludis]